MNKKIHIEISVVINDVNAGGETYPSRQTEKSSIPFCFLNSRGMATRRLIGDCNLPCKEEKITFPKLGCCCMPTS